MVWFLDWNMGNMGFSWWEIADFDFIVKDQSMWTLSADGFSNSVTFNVFRWFLWVWEDNVFATFVIITQGFWA